MSRKTMAKEPMEVLFQKDPVVVVGAFHRLLAPGGKFDRRLDPVKFSVLDRSEGHRTFDALVSRFGAAANLTVSTRS